MSATTATTTGFPISPPRRVDRRRGLRAEFLDRATKMDPAALAPADRVSLRVMRYQLETAVALDKVCAPFACGFGDNWSPVTQFDGPQFDVPQLVDATRFASVRDYEAYLKRLDALPVQLDQLVARMEMGMKLGWMPAKIAIARVPGQLDAQLKPDPTQSPEYKPFREFPADIAPPERERLAADGRRVIKDKVIPAFRRLRDFYERRYLPAASASIASSSLPPGIALLRGAARPLHDDAHVTPRNPRSRSSRGGAHRQGDGCDGRRRRLQGHARRIPAIDQHGSEIFLHEGRGHARRLSGHREARRCRAAAPLCRAAASSLWNPADASGGGRQRRALRARRGGWQPGGVLRGQRQFTLAAPQMVDGNSCCCTRPFRAITCRSRARRR